MIRRLSWLPTRSDLDMSEDENAEPVPSREDFETWYRQTMERKIA